MSAVMYVGDAVSVMNRLPEKSVDLILTSPPFLALRSYLPADHPDKALEGGSQATPGAFIDWLIDVVEACDRVLAPHGSMCIELGDTYAGSGGAGGDYGELCPQQSCNDGLDTGSFPKGAADCKTCHGTGRVNAKRGGGVFRQSQPAFRRGTDRANAQGPGASYSGGSGWPLAKSLSLIPELFRLTLVYGQNPLTGRQTERWRLRNVVRWVRPNPPVGALCDKFRPATSELMVFCKSAKRFFDLDAVREDFKSEGGGGRGGASADGGKRQGAGVGRWEKQMNTHSGAPPLDWWNIPPGGYQGAHYATFPKELCVKPIKAMCPEKVCRQCGEPSRRITDVTFTHDVSHANGAFVGESYGVNAPAKVQPGPQGMAHGRATKNVETLGFSDCGHDDWRPGLVLDPFGGSGTTALVATGHGRDAILIDLDERNYELALDRVGPLVLSKGEVAA